MPTRVLILSAGIGKGTTCPPGCSRTASRARAGHRRARRRRPRRDGPDVDAARRRRLGLHVRQKANWLFDFSYLLLARFPPTRAFARWLTHRLGTRGLTRLIAEWQPDVIVSTYPGVTEVLGHLRERGRIAVPVVSAITDLAGLYYWAHRGVDLHLITEPESVDELQAVAPGARFVCVRGLTSAGFEMPVDAGGGA